MFTYISYANKCIYFKLHGNTHIGKTIYLGSLFYDKPFARVKCQEKSIFMKMFFIFIQIRVSKQSSCVIIYRSQNQTRQQ